MDNTVFRIDAEFFNRNVMDINRKIKGRPWFSLKPDEIVSGPFGSTLKSDAYLTEGEIPFVRIENIRGGFDIDTDNIIYISQSDNERIRNSQLQTDDIVLSKVGNSIGFFARVDKSMGICNISENIIGIKLAAYREIEKHYILAYLNCKYGQKLILRRTSGNAQPKLNVEDLCHIPIPRFKEDFYIAISQCVLESKSLNLHSKNLYNRMSEELLHLLNYAEVEAKSVAVKKMSKSIALCGRWDAEYFQPKYDRLFEVLDKLNTYSLGGQDGLVHIQKSIEPGSDAYQEEGIPFVRVSDVDKFKISMPELKLSKDIVSNAESLYLKKDMILFSKDGSVGIAYKVQEDLEMITSSALLHLTIKDTNVILPDYLTLVLNSPIVQLQAARDSNGAVIQHWKPSDIEKVIIPVLDMKTQKYFAKELQTSFALRKESICLLNLAMRTVEKAIETDEKTALSWLEMKK